MLVGVAAGGEKLKRYRKGRRDATQPKEDQVDQ